MNNTLQKNGIKELNEVLERSVININYELSLFDGFEVAGHSALGIPVNNYGFMVGVPLEKIEDKDNYDQLEEYGYTFFKTIKSIDKSKYIYIRRMIAEKDVISDFETKSIRGSVRFRGLFVDRVLGEVLDVDIPVKNHDGTAYMYYTGETK